VQAQTTGRATVNTNGQRFLDRCSTAAAFLAGACWIDSDNLDTGTFSLAFEDANEAAPGSITDRASQPVIPDHPSDVQAFHRDDSEAAHKIERYFVVVIAPLFTNAEVDTSQLSDSLFPVFPATPFSTDRSGSATQRRERRLQVSRIFNMFTVVCCQERFEADVNATRWFGALFDFNISKVAGKDGIPLSSVFLERDSLDASFNLSMLLYANCSYMLNAEFFIDELDAVTIGRELDGVEPATSFEPRVSGFFTSFDAPKKILEGFVETAHRGLGTGEVEPFEVGIDVALFLVPGRLLGVLDRARFLLPSIFSLPQADVIQTPMRLDHSLQFSKLVSIRKDSEFVGTTHCLLSLLFFDISLDSVFADTTNGTCIVATTPERRQPGAQRGKLPSKFSRSPSFEAINNLGDTESGIGLDEKVNVVWHNLESVDYNLELISDFVEQCDESCFDVVDQNGSAILWTPDKVIFERENRTSVFAVPAHSNEVCMRQVLSQEKKEDGHSPVA
jgi:hypothetical protein